MKSRRISTANIKSARERILLTAHDLFYKDGIRATGVDRLIARSSVTKTTFYRHFPGKNDLIRDFLDYRHQLWTIWFRDRLQHHGNNADAITPALAEWFSSADFRGCAFINSLGELGGDLPEIIEITRRHKKEMTDIIETVLPRTQQRKHNAQAIALAIDGAIIRAQFDQSPKAALSLLQQLVKACVSSSE